MTAFGSHDDFSSQRIGERLCDPDWHQLADEADRCRKVDDPVVVRAAHEFVVILARGSLHHHDLSRAHHAASNLGSLLVDTCLKSLEALKLVRLRRVIRQVGGRCAWPARVDKRERRVKTNLVNQLHGFVEVIFRFTWKANNEVG